jgi:hypothetical protein
LKSLPEAEGGNGLYILDIKRAHKIERADLLNSMLIREEYGQVAGNRMFYVMSGQVIKMTDQIQCDEVAMELPGQ